MLDIVKVTVADIRDQTCNVGGCDGDLQVVVMNVLRYVFGIVGILAVVMIVLGGVSYATSQGDPQRIKKAKDTILYSVIGLVIALAAFAIVSFILEQIINN